jgi:glucose dehydrogenase
MKPVTQKTKPFRSKKYTDWVKSLPCCVCGTDQCIDPHHLKGHGHGGTRKADDRLTMPLCAEHHHNLHHYGHNRFDQRYSTMRQAGQIYFVNITLGKARVQKTLTADQIDEARELIR